jgi:endonuclease YncB( thermonuclease family)
MELSSSLNTILMQGSIQTPYFNFDGFTTYAKVVKVVDGDTIHFVCMYHNELKRFIGRINKINTPELTNKDPEVKQIAMLAKNEVTKLLLDKIVTVKFYKPDLYGRQLIDVTFENDNGEWIDLATHLLEKNLAVPYIP